MTTGRRDDGDGRDGGLDLGNAGFLARALEDEGLERRIKFGYTNGAVLWRRVKAAAAARLRALAAREEGGTEAALQDRDGDHPTTQPPNYQT